jgi:hypothetical protein
MTWLTPRLPQLQQEVVRLGAHDLVRRGDHGLPVVDVVLVGGQEVGAGAGETLGRVRTLAAEHSHGAHEPLERITEPPLLVGRVEVVRRYRDGDSRQLRGVEQFADMSDGVVLADAVTEHRPRHAVRAEEVDLWIGDDECGVLEVEHETGRRQRRVLRFGVAGRVCHELNNR